MGRKLVRFLAALAFLTGLGIFLYPTAEKYLAHYQTRKVIENFQEQVEKTAAGDSGKKNEDSEEIPVMYPDSETAEEEEENGKTDSEELTAEQMEQAYRDLQAYNERLYQEGQSGMNDPFDYENSEIDLTSYGFSENMIGTVWIPRMEVELPIYLGADYANLAKGAALLGQTSMPLGTPNSNVVLAGHRGWKGIPMFRNIQALQLGDKIQIETPWETLVYRVCELRIIYPGDTREILIQEGRDLVTLLTCHPYTQNYQRYMVIAERSMEEVVSHEADIQEAEAVYDESPRRVEVLEPDGTVTQETVEPESIRPVGYEGAESGAQYSNLQIWLEDYGIWFAFAMVMIVIGMMIIHSIESAVKHHRKKNN